MIYYQNSYNWEAVDKSQWGYFEHCNCRPGHNCKPAATLLEAIYLYGNDTCSCCRQILLRAQNMREIKLRKTVLWPCFKVTKGTSHTAITETQRLYPAIPKVVFSPFLWCLLMLWKQYSTPQKIFFFLA